MPTTENTNKPKLFKHYRNGHTYQLLNDKGIYEPTGELQAHYRDIDSGQEFYRPLIEFYEEVEDPNNSSVKIRRFSQVANS